jgi:hypothetical protein
MKKSYVKRLDVYITSFSFAQSASNLYQLTYISQIMRLILANLTEQKNIQT